MMERVPLLLLIEFSMRLSFLEAEGTIFFRILQSLPGKLEDKVILFYYKIMNMGKVA
jgi:hypothetical protein